MSLDPQRLRDRAAELRRHATSGTFEDAVSKLGAALALEEIGGMIEADEVEAMERARAMCARPLLTCTDDGLVTATINMPEPAGDE